MPTAIAITTTRAKAAFNVRVKAAQLALDRGTQPSISNGEEASVPTLIASFTKGLRHLATGEVARPGDFAKFVNAASSGDEADIAALPLGPERDASGKPVWKSKLAKKLDLQVRGWESMAAGLTFDLQGPDAQSVSMPPAPIIGSAELSAEIAELYLMALARDLPFSAWNASKNNEFFQFAINQLNSLEWFAKPAVASDPPAEIRRRRGKVTIENIFRGILPGSQTGPFLSQFLIIGSSHLGTANAADETNGIFRYGSITVDQRVRIADSDKDFLTNLDTFIDAQNAADFRGLETYKPGKRLMKTMRDLATWVHFDALYQAYLNACMIMLAKRVPFDPSLPFTDPEKIDAQEGFVTFGPPHILSLVTEVATRALKAVRYQKFNIHRRARPEAIGGLVHVHKTAAAIGEDVFPEVRSLVADLDPVLFKIAQLNEAQNRNGEENSGPSYLLPMAFAEGSPMHPSYGSGHATVAGACVTILKAFFKADEVFENVFEVDPVNDTLVKSSFTGTLTIGSELNKLADNISIGRNMAGVHYFTDAFESLLLGEQIAIGILEEQKLTFGEIFFFNLNKFDGTDIKI